MNMNNSMRSFCLGILGTLFTMTPVWADDTEIFFGGTTNISVRPNVLFILDTSGSMGSTDGTGSTRLDRMKDALGTIINSAQDINVGLMRFSNPGGAVIYPVTYIDESISSTTGGALSGVAEATVSSGSNDAEEQSGGTVVLDNEALSLMTQASVNISGTIDVQINHDDDDAEERVSNSQMTLGSSDLELMRDGGNYNKRQLVGLRFNNVDIPKDATITAASIEFEVDQKRSGNVYIDIYGEDSSFPERYSTSKGDISDRTKVSGEKVNWNFTSNPNKNNALESTDISNIVQHIVNRSDWAAMNSMAFILEEDPSDGNNNYRELESHDGESDAAPILHVTYEYSVSSVNNSVVGLRFEGLMIPQGADITSATLSLVSATDSGASTSLSLYAEDADNSAEFTTANSDLSDRDTTSSSVSWTPTSWDEGESYQAPDLANVIEEVVERSGWCGGNDLSLLIEGSGARFAKSFDLSSTESAVLSVEYDVDSVDDDACMVNEYSVMIDSEDDDVEEFSNGYLLTNSTDLDLINDSYYNSGNQTIGLRFNNIQLNEDAQIASAYIEFAATGGGDSGSVELVIEAENVDDASAFSNSNKPSSRSTLNDTVSWVIDSTWDAENEIHRTPDLSDLMEQVVARSGWEAGNSIVFTISGTGGRRSAYSYDGSTLAPKLVYLAQETDVPVSNNTVRTTMIDIINEMEQTGNTPIVETLYEAALYYRGEGVDYGKQRGVYRRAKDRVSHPLSYTGGTLVQPAGCTADNLSSSYCEDEEITGNPVYTSPITESCQANYIVMLTDGNPVGSFDQTKIKEMMGYGDSDSCNGSGAYACGHDLVAYLNNNDQLASMGDDQTVKTFTIGFNFSSDWMQEMAVEGGGSFHEASSSADLVDAFDAIIKSIKATDSTYVAPSVTSNQFNRFSHRDDIYYSLFKPQETAQWVGNLKKYRLAGNPAQVVDADGNAAVDDTTGFFKDDARSEWSATADGNSVENGGMASRLPAPETRRIYTYLGSQPVLNDGTELLSAYPLNSSNTDITRDLLDIPSQSSSYRSGLLNWVIGFEGDGVTPRYAIGDPLHSSPVLMTYDSDSDAQTYDSTIFIGTNEGFIHAVDTDTGEEVFSFIPEELLGNLDTYYSNEIVSPRPYGMDGDITLWSNDENNDGDYFDDDDFVYLYAGMRRGGRSYYALDVSDRAAPKMLWQIKGGSSGTTGFAELGQTWSAPKKLQIRFDNEVHDVLLFAGGYDENQDNVNVRTADTMGRAIYMVNAEDGSLFWSAGSDNSYNLELTDMRYSLPSDINIVDIDGDGLTDQFYVGDMGGQVWRFDINQSNVSDKTDLVNGGVIADLAGDTAASNRRFYYPPDLSINVTGSNRYMGVAIGSGYRAHPLNEAIEDRFYLIKQFTDIYTAPTSYTKLAESDLYDATLNLITEGNSTEREDATVGLSNSDTNRSQGWYIKMTNTGEKVLAESLTINGQILFTTYEPAAPSVSTCQPANGIARVYIVGVSDATPQGDLDEDDDVDKQDRVVTLTHGNIPSQPTVVDTVDSDPTIMVGTESVPEVNTGQGVVKTYWFEKESD
ncbi:PilC/PilY family type IV pilus protein [Amphritea sp. 2_MG-2023]|uniref:PilC/PilY family type IV pilus protein n=1 Tax=Amphritea TaxID=515417 RepID=UPI001C07691A|nr:MULTISPECIES: PilC/PilY family type IV pilus protein [Amphritea]MBU2963977.1 VWA domain-containing protein [Amphritea atlantica]MDO6420319.1 PilC/PilY family type IV pilus protein [Amphritea sp. 2_MG-2023]